MTLTPFEVETFGGLNLDADPLEVGAVGAVDLRNAWLSPGRVESLCASTSFATATRNVLRLFAHAGTQVLASETDGTNTTLQAFDSSGSSVASATYASGSIYPHGFASIGTTTVTRTYAVRAGESTYKWNGSVWTAMGGMPTGSCAAPSDNGARLAIGGTTNDHRVSFSNVGDPETFGTDDWVDITPGDGEYIGDLVAWRDKLFAFKQTKFAVFTGEGVDADGGAIFNFYMVATGQGVGSKGTRPAGGACAGRDAVFFMGSDGIYATTGDTPVLVSKAIAPLWPTRPLPGYTTVPGINTQWADLGWAGDALYVSATTRVGVSNGLRATLVLRDGQWTYLDIQANTATPVKSIACNVIDFLDTPLYATTNSTAIKYLSLSGGPGATSWSYTSGRYALAPGQVATTLESSVVGSGTVAMSVTTDLYGTLAGPGATLGTAPATAEGWPMRDQEGTWFQHTLSGSTAASVSRLTHHVNFVKPGGVR